jgi:hypothetical protein
MRVRDGRAGTASNPSRDFALRNEEKEKTDVEV